MTRLRPTSRRKITGARLDQHRQQRNQVPACARVSGDGLIVDSGSREPAGASSFLGELTCLSKISDVLAAC